MGPNCHQPTYQCPPGWRPAHSFSVCQVRKTKLLLFKSILINPSLLGDGVQVAIIVGPEGSTKTFKLPKGVLTHLSPFMAATFAAGHWKEGQLSQLRLPQFSIRCLEHAVAWFFNFGQTDPSIIHWPWSDHPSANDFIQTMIEVSELSQYLGNPSLDRVASNNLEPFLRRSAHDLTNDHILEAYSKLDDRSCVRYTISSAAFRQFASPSWDITNDADPLTAWVYGDALQQSPGFLADFLRQVKGFFQGRIPL